MANFVYVHTHDSGRFMEPYGVAADNPALSQLAREGILFRNMYCEAPTCSPSRSAMLTGTYAHCCGMLGLAHRGFSLNDYDKHLAHHLSRNGYHTELIGVYHESDENSVDKLGYNEWHFEKQDGNTATDLNHLALVKEFLKGAKSLEKPFFLSFGLLNTHRPFPKAKSGRQDYVLPPFPVANTPENRLDWCDYLESLSEADYCVGELVNSLRENDFWDDTIVLFTTDHGPAYPNMKCNLYDTGTGVAFILRIPGKAHKVCDALCSQIDVYPTICDLLNVEKPEWLQGKSMLPLIEGEKEEINEFVFSEITFHASYEPSRCVRSKGYKLIRFFDGGETRKMSNTDASSAKSIYFDRPLAHEPRPKELFFDLIADPAERINLADDPAYAGEYARHAKALDEWMAVTDDPMLRGENMYTLGRGKLVTPPDAAEASGNRYIVWDE